jgi:F-type H+-transporting ATPase subunit epsilon
MAFQSASTLHCQIVSAEEELFHGEANLVVATGLLGELGITPGHAPLITQLKPGYVRVVEKGGTEQSFYISGGILEVQPKVATVLSDTAVRAKDLDEAKVKQAQEAARSALEGRSTEMSVAEAQAAMVQAAAQLHLIQQLKKTKG